MTKTKPTNKVMKARNMTNAKTLSVKESSSEFETGSLFVPKSSIRIRQQNVMIDMKFTKGSL
eukprot:CAMPEP_0169211798 /NCGR_PEP_ID=MMETSP1016-20121227/15947_1 /TAXON_ID=342587 /ORGANISM="Karlodinium micrum, Strain CCMP2283" /LENGTH=61 /DNA_ID=CAMNT_0009289443 /DNA_START=280 /DNA_END=465 /DNA_ORIENTATION=+